MSNCSRNLVVRVEYGTKDCWIPHWAAQKICLDTGDPPSANWLPPTYLGWSRITRLWTATKGLASRWERFFCSSMGGGWLPQKRMPFFRPWLSRLERSQRTCMPVGWKRIPRKCDRQDGVAINGFVSRGTHDETPPDLPPLHGSQRRSRRPRGGFRRTDRPVVETDQVHGQRSI